MFYNSLAYTKDQDSIIWLKKKSPTTWGLVHPGLDSKDLSPLNLISLQVKDVLTLPTFSPPPRTQPRTQRHELNEN